VSIDIPISRKKPLTCAIGVVGLDVIALFMLSVYFILSANLFHLVIYNKVPGYNCDKHNFLCERTIMDS
jgi:hypothetical protein